jgi:hypothetical protein
MTMLTAIVCSFPINYISCLLRNQTLIGWDLHNGLPSHNNTCSIYAKASLRFSCTLQMLSEITGTYYLQIFTIMISGVRCLVNSCRNLRTMPISIRRILTNYSQHSLSRSIRWSRTQLICDFPSGYYHRQTSVVSAMKWISIQTLPNKMHIPFNY